ETGARYVFAYTITIRNLGSMPAQLISRHWVITDSQGLVQEVRGLGVVGSQPLLQPGESFQYTSGTSIATPVGTMRGSYQMRAEAGAARVPAADRLPSVPAGGSLSGLPGLSAIQARARDGTLRARELRLAAGLDGRRAGTEPARICRRLPASRRACPGVRARP